MISDNEKLIVVKQYDSLCKKSFANVVKNYYSHKARQYERFVFYDDLKKCNINDTYFQKQYIFYVDDIPVIIDNRNIAAMLMKLDSDRRKIILLYYFAGFNDKNISKILNIPRATVQYRRKRALNDMKNLF